jgi:hypothetical protein
MIEGQAPNTVELANLLPLETGRQDMREQWLRRLLKNPLLLATAVMEPFAREELAKAARNGQTVLLSMDLGDRMAVLMVGLRVGDRALPLAWLAETGTLTSVGFHSSPVTTAIGDPLSGIGRDGQGSLSLQFKPWMIKSKAIPLGRQVCQSIRSRCWASYSKRP